MYDPTVVQHFFATWIDSIVPPELDDAAYRHLVIPCLTRLNQHPTRTAAHVLVSAVASYPQAARATILAELGLNEHTDHHQSWRAFVHTYLNNYENLVFLTLKQRQYQRWPGSADLPERATLEEQSGSDLLVNLAIHLPYQAALQFLSTVSGAWILTHPERLVRHYCGFSAYFGDRATTDDDYIFMLSSLIIEHGTAWMRH